MATITDEIDLTKSIPDVSPCKTCTISTLRSNAHSSHIRKGELPLELVHSDVLGPFRIGYNGARQKERYSTALDTLRPNMSALEG
jgi:hypothetical protein